MNHSLMMRQIQEIASTFAALRNKGSVKEPNGRVIPVVLCFNDNYYVAAAVAIHSLLKVSADDYCYELYVLHSDVTAKHQKMLQKIVSEFQNAEIVFLNLGSLFDDYFTQVAFQSYWSKEIFYKCILSSLFPQYKRIMISDVDVLFRRDISGTWETFLQDTENYLAGTMHPALKTESNGEFADMIYKDWSPDERKKVLTCAGLWMQNLELMRQNNIEEKMLQFIDDNVWRLTQPEQQVVNMVCYPKIAMYPPMLMVLASNYVDFKTDADYQHADRFLPEDVQMALAHPIQLHYASGYKPWNCILVPKAWLWWSHLLGMNRIQLTATAACRLISRGAHLKVLREKIRKKINESSFFHGLYKLYRTMRPQADKIK